MPEIVKRSELATFLPTDRLVRVFDALINNLNVSIPNQQQSNEIDAAGAQAQASQALAELASVAQQLSDILAAPIQQVEPAPDQHTVYLEQIPPDQYTPAPYPPDLGEDVSFRNVTTRNAASLINSGVTLTNGAGAATGTLTNAPTAGNPTKWIQINDNGTIRRIPSW